MHCESECDKISSHLSPSKMKSEKLGIFLKRKKVTVSIATKDQIVLLMEMMMKNVTIK
jgi:hypothetical protein